MQDIQRSLDLFHTCQTVQVITEGLRWSNDHTYKTLKAGNKKKKIQEF